MPAPKKRTETLVGLFIFTGFLLLGGLILQFGSFRERLVGHYELTITFDDASGVIKGSEVRMGGARIGRVSSLPELTDDVRVEVDVSIVDKIRIPRNSQFFVESATLLGDKLIVVYPPEERTGAFIEPGSEVDGGGLTGLEALQNNAQKLSVDALRIIRQAGDTFAKIDTAVTEIRAASTELSGATTKINGSLLSDANLQRFDEILKNLSSAAGRWNAASSEIEPTLHDARNAIASIKTAAAGARTTLESADRAIADIKPALNRIPEAVDEFTGTAKKTGDALDRIKNGEGLLGALASDNEVAVDIKSFVRNLKDYGILRYKNPEPENAAPGKTDSGSKPKFGLRQHRY